MRLSRAGRWQWPALIVLTGILTILGLGLKVSSAYFVGPMLAGILFAFGGSNLRIDRRLTLLSQAVVGAVVARALDAPVLALVAIHWPVIVVVVLITAFSSCLVAWGLVRVSHLDGQTAAWGSMPGAASVMVSLAAQYGGDTRQVALMQYFRMVVVITTASIVHRLLLGTEPVHTVVTAAIQPDTGLYASSVPVFETLLVGAVGLGLGTLLKIPAGPLLVTAVIGMVLHLFGLIDLDMPRWLLIVAYGLVGWFAGLQFDRQLLASTMRSLPVTIGATFVLISVCSVAGWILARAMKTDLLTGYLATSPGAIDSITILALNSNANTSIVMSVQTIRFFSIIVIAPYLVKLICHFIRDQPAASAVKATPGI